MRLFNIFSFTISVIISLGSCVSAKKQTDKALYFRGISDSLLQKAMVEYEPVFQKGDILSITVITPNESSARLFNQPVSNVGGASAEDGTVSAAPSQGYLVNEKGNITFPFVGDVKAAGLTRAQLTDALSERVRKYIDSAIVSIRLTNYRITVLGEVMRPGTFSIPSERVTVLDAIGLAGDLSVYGKRNNIRVIRTSGGNRQTGTLDLNKGDIFDSPFFYLRQNDIVYVEMNEKKLPNSDQASLRRVSIALGIISALGVVISTRHVLQ